MFGLEVPILAPQHYSRPSVTLLQSLCVLFLTQWTVSIISADPYIYRTIPRPDPAIDPDVADIWDKNDIYAQILITGNITKQQMVHISCLNTVHEIWHSLEAIHGTHDHQVAVAIQRTLFGMKANKTDDIPEHLTELKKQWECLNMVDDDDFHISDKQFKTIIASSLPNTWDVFTEPYVGGHKGVVEFNPKKLSGSQEFIGVLKEEYIHHKDWMGNQTLYSNSKQVQGGRKAKKHTNDMCCTNCGHNSHWTNDCKWLGKLKCEKCGWFGHIAANCYHGQKRKVNDGGGGKQKQAKMEQETEQTH